MADETVLLVPARDRAAIVVSGKDRVRWLNGLVTCDLAKMVLPGDGAGSKAPTAAYGLLVEKKGRIQSDMFIVPSADALALAVPAALRDTLLPTLDHYLIMEDAELSASDVTFWTAHGPRAAELVGLTPFGGALDLLGAGGAVLAAPAALRPEVEARLLERVAALGGRVADEAGWEAVRIERGLPSFGVEFDTSFYPQEASIEKLAVAFDKGCYLGQEVVYMLENRGHVKRKLVSLELDGVEPMATGTEVTTPAGEAVGDVKSATVAPSTGRIVAMAMVKWAHTKPGTELLAGGRPARVRPPLKAT